MVFKCQEDGFLKEFTTTVVSCEQVEPGKFDVICEDTILFPEGGGQPWDTGFLNEHVVTRVLRKGSQAVHRVEVTGELGFAPGDSVQQKLDWDRRHNHMQQHSGQHLLSALFEQDYLYATKSWWLGTDTSYIELDSKIPITAAEIQDIEDRCNAYIAQALPVTVSVFESPSVITSEDVKRATRGLPADHVGQIRVINIDGVDSNLCCGTHVTNLAQLQSIKLLNLERPNKNKLILHFLVGNRIGKRLQTMFEREQKMNVLLNNGPSSHLDLIEKMSGNIKRMQKAIKLLSMDSAILEVEKLKKQNSPPPSFLVIKRVADECDAATFQNKLVREVKDNFPDLRVLVIIMEDKPSSQLMLSCGDEELLKQIAMTLCDVLGISGVPVCKNGRFQTKFTAKPDSAKKCNQVLEDVLKAPLAQ